MKTYAIKYIKKMIYQEFPELDIQEITWLGEGDNNWAFRVNQEYVFRFPKHLKAEETVKTEARLLKNLQPHVNVLIPDFKFIGNQARLFAHTPYDNTSRISTNLDFFIKKIYRVLQRYVDIEYLKLILNKYERLFVGYKEIPGIMLSNDIVVNLPANIKYNIAKDIAQFLVAVHSFPVEDAKKMGVSEWDFTDTYYLSFYKIIQKYVCPEISWEEQQLLQSFFVSYISQSNNWKYTPLLIHGDMSFDHFIYNSFDKKLSGIIDFGGIYIGDIDYDFYGIYTAYGLDFLQLILNNYGGEIPEKMLHKFQIFSGCDAAYRIKLGKESKNQELLDKGWQEMKKLLLELQEK